jgi:preprotein translocase subunit SecY
MEKITRKFKVLLSDKVLLSRIFFVIGMFFIFRFLAAIPVPGVDAARLNEFLSNNQFFGILNLFSGGGLSTLSIMMLGVGPYITGSIIMQLLTIMVPRLKALYHEEGEAGRKKFSQYSRILTIPLAILQGFSLLAVLVRQGVIDPMSTWTYVVNIAVITAGCLLLMWLGELISEFGIGNGVSIIIFAGIVASLPANISQFFFTFDIAQIPTYLVFLVVGLVIIAGVVAVSEAERPVPVTYAKQVRGNSTSGGVSTYIPLRLNQAGVMPIIFALSILMFPQLIGNFLAGSTNAIAMKVSHAFIAFSQNTWLYGVLYFVLVALFTYFYTAVTFDPQALSTNLQKNGAFIPGIRPGASTAEFIDRVLSRITLAGALFLGLIAVLPLIMQSATGIQSLSIGGTSLLIAISVSIDLIKKIDAQLSMREY